jgi:hypothetical protein
MMIYHKTLGWGSGLINRSFCVLSTARRLRNNNNHRKRYRNVIIIIEFTELKLYAAAWRGHFFDRANCVRQGESRIRKCKAFSRERLLSQGCTCAAVARQENGGAKMLQNF